MPSSDVYFVLSALTYIASKLVHIINAYLPISVTDSGIVIDTKLEHSAKACSQMCVTVVGTKYPLSGFPAGNLTRLVKSFENKMPSTDL